MEVVLRHHSQHFTEAKAMSPTLLWQPSQREEDAGRKSSTIASHSETPSATIPSRTNTFQNIPTTPSRHTSPRPLRPFPTSTHAACILSSHHDVPQESQKRRLRTRRRRRIPHRFWPQDKWVQFSPSMLRFSPVSRLTPNFGKSWSPSTQTDRQASSVLFFWRPLITPV